MTTATTTATSERATLPEGSYRLDPIHSSVGFEVKHMISTFRGSFASFDARLEGGSGEARLEGAADVASIDVRDEDLAAHLMSPEFFGAEAHPRISFLADEIDLRADGTLGFRGTLTIKGITRPIRGAGRLERIEADMGGGERLGLELDATVDRREYEMTWNAALPGGGFALGDDVKLVAHLQLVPTGGE